MWSVVLSAKAGEPWAIRLGRCTDHMCRPLEIALLFWYAYEWPLYAPLFAHIWHSFESRSGHRTNGPALGPILRPHQRGCSLPAMGQIPDRSDDGLSASTDHRLAHHALGRSKMEEACLRGCVPPQAVSPSLPPGDLPHHLWRYPLDSGCREVPARIPILP